MKTPFNTYLFHCVRAFPILSLAGVGSLVLLSGCGPAKLPVASQASLSATARPVSVARVGMHPLERTIKVIGTLLPNEQAVLSTKVAGRLQSISPDLGTQVQDGELLAQVEPREYQARLLQAEAALAQARARLGLPLKGDSDDITPEKASTVKEAQAVLREAEKNRDRISRLYQQKISSESDLETVQSAYEVAANRYEEALQDIQERRALLAERRAQYELARQMLEDSAIRAPFSGTVQERRSHLGEYLIVGNPVFVLVRTDPLRLQVEIPEREAWRVQKEQAVRLTVEGDPTVYHGILKRLSPSLHPQNRMLIAEADIPNAGKLRPGAFARAEIVVEKEQKVTTIPASALVVFAGVEKVYRIQDGKAVATQVTTGRRIGEQIEILSGLKPDSTVILSPGTLAHGQAVVVVVGKETAPLASQQTQPRT